MTAAVTFAGDRLGRRRTLVALSALTMCGYVAVTFATRAAWLLPAAFAGMLNGMGRDRGPAGALEQAILPEITGAAHRTWVLAWYNLVIDAGHAFGGLAGMVPTLLASHAGLSLPEAHRWTFGMCGGAAAAGVIPYAMLSNRVEIARVPAAAGPPPENDRGSRHAIAKLALTKGTGGMDVMIATSCSPKTRSGDPRCWPTARCHRRASYDARHNTERAAAHRCSIMPIPDGQNGNPGWTIREAKENARRY